MDNIKFNSITELFSTFTNEGYCIRYLEKLRWNGKVVSPFDTYSKVYKCRSNRYRCKNTGKYFNAKTGTIFHNSKIEMNIWFAAIWLFIENPTIASTQLSKKLGLTQKTAWLMRQKIKIYLQKENIFLQPANNPIVSMSQEPAEKTEDKRNVSAWLRSLKK